MRWSRHLALLLCLLPTLLWAAVAQDTSANCASTALGGTTCTASTVVNTASNRLLKACLCYQNQITAVTTTSVVFNTTENLAQVTSGRYASAATGTAEVVCEQWFVVAPTQTTANTVATISATTNVAMVVITYTGVDQTTPLGAIFTLANNTNVSSRSVTVTDGVSGDLLDDCMGKKNSTENPTAGTDQTFVTAAPIASGSAVAADNVVIGVSTQAGSGDGVMSQSWGTSRRAVTGAIAIKQAAGSTTPRRRMIDTQSSKLAPLRWFLQNGSV